MSRKSYLPQGLTILYEDDDILVVDKPSGLLTIATEKEKIKTAYHALTDYVRKGNARSSKRIFIVHRLDRETSGALVFAKTQEAKDALQAQWQDTDKRYLAVVPGTLAEKTATLTSYLAENAAHVVYSTHDSSKGKFAQTAYRVLKETGEFTLLEVSLLTGRKHQIRVHLADKGYPVVGDKRYGRKESSHKRLALHAQSIAFNHPVSGKRVDIAAKIPVFFLKLVGNIPKSEGQE